MRFWSSDQHIDHTNIIGYSGRPYDTVEEMNADIQSRWNARVRYDDIGVWLGDYSLRPEALRMVSGFNGSLILRPGNHDPVWEHRTRHLGRRIAEYHDAGFEAITYQPSTAIAATDWPWATQVRIDHFPYANEDPYDDRYAEHRPVDEGMWLLHGHVHEKWRQRGRMINVGSTRGAGGRSRTGRSWS